MPSAPPRHWCAILDLPLGGAVLGEAPAGSLAEGIDHLLAGRPAAAFGPLRTAAQTGDPSTHARASAWGWLAAVLRANAFPGGVAAGGIEVQARLHDLYRHPDSPDDIPAAFALEQRVVRDVLPMLRVTRSLLEPDVGRPEHADEALAILDDVRLEALDRGDVPLAVFCQRSAADLEHRRADGERARHLLIAARATAEEAGDQVGMAACSLMAGDWALAPYTHPEAADYLPRDSGTETSELPWAVESQEADPARMDLPAAADAYDDAGALFASAGARSGGGAVALRRSLMATAAGEHDAALSAIDQALRAAEATGDDWLGAATRVHALLARVAAGKPAGDSAAPEEVGRWGRTDGSFSAALGSGLVLARAGRQWLVRHGDADRSLVAHRPGADWAADSLTTRRFALFREGRAIRYAGRGHSTAASPPHPRHRWSSRRLLAAGITR